MRVHDLDLVAFEHRYIDELARFIATVMLDNEESRRRDFEPAPVAGPDGAAPAHRLWPHRHGTDAMFYGGIRRRSDSTR